jgi:lipopolysaccharide export LptBFGC system permease protein LptF
VEYLEYYDGLDWKGLIYNHYWLIVVIEAAWYCESRHEKYIRYSRLKEKSNESLKRLTKGIKTDLGGTFNSIIHSDRCKNFLRIRIVKNENNNKKETWIYPKISAIQNEIKNRKIENLNNGGDRLEYLRKGEHRHPSRSPKETEAVQVSEFVSRQRSKARTLGDSVQVSGKPNVVVTHTNSKEVSK